MLVRYLEEALAETVATGSLRTGLKFPLTGYGITLGQLLGEAALYFGGLGAAFAESDWGDVE
jgi:hypothetical protein